MAWRRQRQQRVALDPVDLVENQDLPLAHIGKRIEQRFRVSLDAALGVDQHQHHVAILGAAPGGRHHRPVKPPLRREDARRVDEHDLGALVNGNAAHDRACGLHLVRDDRDLGADKLVDQVDLPAFGAPISATNPDRVGPFRRFRGSVHLFQVYQSSCCPAFALPDALTFEECGRRGLFGCALGTADAAGGLGPRDLDNHLEHRLMVGTRRGR
jgi:hypothetical protein